MNALGRFTHMLCGVLGVTPAHLDEMRQASNGNPGSSALRAYEWGVDRDWGTPVNVAQVRLRYGWPVG